ncbi:MAG: hypothetical protein AAF039_06310, partial [Bacteroidota bacterium]
KRESNGFFEIIGRVTSQNVTALKVYFDTVLELNDAMVVSVEKVQEMDSSAALFFESFYRGAAAQNKIVTIIGRQNDGIFKIMEATKTAYILSSDRV